MLDKGLRNSVPFGQDYYGRASLPGAEYRYKPTAAALLAEANVFVDQSFRRRKANCRFFLSLWNSDFWWAFAIMRM